MMQSDVLAQVHFVVTGKLSVHLTHPHDTNIIKISVVKPGYYNVINDLQESTN